MGRRCPHVPTCSTRRRPDRSKLAAGEMGSAGSEKVRLEEMQRAERRERDKRADGWTPRWFRKVDSPTLYEGEQRRRRREGRRAGLAAEQHSKGGTGSMGWAWAHKDAGWSNHAEALHRHDGSRNQKAACAGV